MNTANSHTPTNCNNIVYSSYQYVIFINQNRAAEAPCKAKCYIQVKVKHP